MWSEAFTGQSRLQLVRLMKNAAAVCHIIIVFFSAAESWLGDKPSGKQTALRRRAQSNCLPTQR